jgi:hypothetical protein
MFRQLAKLAQPARHWDPSDPDGGPTAGERIAADSAPAKPAPPISPAATSSPTTAAPGPLAERDVRVSFNLLYQAIIRFSDPRPKTGQVLVDAQTLEEMRQKLIAQEAARLKLKSDLEYAHQCAHAYWDRCKGLEAELDQLRAGPALRSVSRARSTRGAL